MAATASATSSDKQYWDQQYLQVVDQQIKDLEGELSHFERGDEFFECLNAGFSISFQEREFTYPGLKIEKGTLTIKIKEIVEKRLQDTKGHLKRITTENPGIEKTPYTYPFSGISLEFLRYQKEMLWFGSRLIPIQIMVKLEDKRLEREKLLQNLGSKV